MYITYDAINGDNKEVKITCNDQLTKKKISLEKVSEEVLLERKYMYASVKCPVCNFYIPSDIVYETYGKNPNDKNIVVTTCNNLIKECKIEGPELCCPHCKSKFIDDSFSKETKRYKIKEFIGSIIAFGAISGVVFGLTKLIIFLINVFRDLEFKPNTSEPEVPVIPDIPTPDELGIPTGPAFDDVMRAMPAWHTMCLQAVGFIILTSGICDICKIILGRDSEVGKAIVKSTIGAALISLPIILNMLLP